VYTKHHQHHRCQIIVVRPAAFDADSKFPTTRKKGFPTIRSCFRHNEFGKSSQLGDIPKVIPFKYAKDKNLGGRRGQPWWPNWKIIEPLEMDDDSLDDVQ
jgi:hypothetical protein